MPDALAPARANPEKLQRVLFNLIQNAIRHTPADGSVVVRAEPVADRIEVEVADTGDGIAPSEREHVFTAFYRGGADAARTGGGAGLGLAVSRAIVEAHGGRIWLADSRGRHPRALQPAARPRRTARGPSTTPDQRSGRHRPAAPDDPVKAPATELAAAPGKADHDGPGALLDRAQQRRQPIAQRAPAVDSSEPESSSPSSTSTVTRSGCRRAISVEELFVALLGPDDCK